MAQRELSTPLDMWGALISPRREGEGLPAYRKRIMHAAEAMADRNLQTEDQWREAREQELEGHLGTEANLLNGANDEALLGRAEEELFTYDELEEIEGPFRWPERAASGPPPLYNWTTPKKGGVARREELELFENENGLIQHGGGYIWVDGQLYYVPTRTERVVFRLPSGTTETALIPWQIKSRHAHKIKIVDETTLELQASGHTHTIERAEDGWNFTSGPHTHEMEPIDMQGPCFLRLSPQGPRTDTLAQTGDTTIDESVDEHVGWPVWYPGPVTVTTNDGDHSHEVDPNDYWTGDFYIYGENHRHEVTDWDVQNAAGHTHTLDDPTIPQTRPLWPRLTKFEDTKIYEDTSNPHIANVELKDGWTKIRVPEGIGGDLSVYFDVEPRGRMPRPEARSGDTIGVGPAGSVSSVVFEEIIESYTGPPLAIRLRVEDGNGGGIQKRKVRVSDNQGHETIGYTGASGRLVARLPTAEPSSVSSDQSRTITAEVLENGSVTVSKDIDLTVEYPGPIDSGFGYDYGHNYGN